MTKTIKLSLAAVAVAGLTTTASAQSMSDAIQNVSVKGYYEYTWEKDLEADTSIDNGGTNELRVQTTAKANDIVALTVRATAYAGGETHVDRTFLTITKGNLTANIGRLGDSSPFTDGMAVLGQVALYKAAPSLTLVGAYYNMDQGASKTADAKDITTIAAIGAADAINYQAWYLAYTDTNNAMFASIDAKVANANIELAYSLKTDESAAASEDQTEIRLVASTEVGNVSVKAAVVQAGKDGAAVEVDGDTDAGVNFASTNLSASSGKDEMGTYLSVGTKLSADMGASLEYFTIGDGQDLTAKVTYQVAKNFSTYARYSTGKTYGDADVSAYKLEMEYSF